MSRRHLVLLPLLLGSVSAAFAVGADQGGHTPAQAVPLHDVTVRADVADTPPVAGVAVRIEPAQLERHNTVEVQDALRFAPNLTIRTRYIGDRNAIIGGRAAGTTQSARSLVYADGLRLSDFLDSGYANPPRWGMVTAQEIAAIDVLYGPFSALYPGNSLGTTVLLHTRMPQHFQASATAQVFSQHFTDAYGTDRHFGGHTTAATLGDRHGRWQWLLAVSHLDNQGQPMKYVTAQPGGDATAAVDVDGATQDLAPDGRARLVAGPGGMDHSTQDLAKLKLGVDLDADTHATFTLGLWHNRSEVSARSYLHDGVGRRVERGVIRVDGRIWTLSPDAFAPSRRVDTQRLLGLQLDGRFGASDWHWHAIGSRYDYQVSRRGDAALPRGDAGRVADNGGSGWQTLDLRADGPLGQAHTLYVGAHLDRYVLDSRVHAASHWRDRADGPLLDAFGGRTRTAALYLQDEWQVLPDWTMTLGARAEHWRAYRGLRADADARVAYPARQASALSPKAALAWAFADDWQLRLSVGRAVRFPTVGELFQGSLSGHAIVDNDPHLRPERAWATDLTLHRKLAHGHWRVSLFRDDIRDSLFTQTDVSVTPSITRVGNIDRVRIRGIEGALQLRDLWPGFDLGASLALNDSVTLRDRAHPAAEGKAFPRIPRVRAKLSAAWRFADSWTLALDGRHSGRQYGSLDNSDRIDTFGAISRFTVFDAKLSWHPAPRWTVAVGVDNFTDRHYWVYHPWPGRTWLATLRWNRP